MKRRIRITLIISLLLNAALIITFGLCWWFVRSEMINFAALNRRAEVHQLQYIITELDPNNPERISSLKKRLQKELKVARWAADTWEKAAAK